MGTQHGTQLHSLTGECPCLQSPPVTSTTVKSCCHKSSGVQTIYKTDTPIPLVRHLVPASPGCIPPGSVCLGLPAQPGSTSKLWGRSPRAAQSVSTFSGGLSSGVLEPTHLHVSGLLFVPLHYQLLEEGPPTQPEAPSSNGHWQASGIRTALLKLEKQTLSLFPYTGWQTEA